MDRRTFLRSAALAAAGLALPGCSEDLLDLLDKGEERLWGMNVHAYGGGRVDLQVRALEILGIRRARITLGLWRDLAGPYLAGYPAQWVGIVGDYVHAGVTARNWPELVRRVVARGHSLAYWEILNEPDLFMGLPAAVYVRDFLRPAFEIIKEVHPSARVAAAAPRGTADGRRYFFDMTDAGADDWCDCRAVHLYTGGAEAFLLSSPGPYLVTESGSADPARHVKWWSEEMPRFSAVLDTELLYWYALMEDPASGYNLIATRPGPDGEPLAVSPLWDHIRENY